MDVYGFWRSSGSYLCPFRRKLVEYQRHRKTATALVRKRLGKIPPTEEVLAFRVILDLQENDRYIKGLMVRVRLLDAPLKVESLPKSRQTSKTLTTLSQLLHSTQFAVKSNSASIVQRISQNVQMFGGSLDEHAGVYIGDEAPSDAPWISLGEQSGTLGPYSVGFINNLKGIAPWAAPMAERPKKGTTAVIIPKRDALPDIVPLLCKQGLGVSWVISVGDGDPSEAMQFLSYDPGTRGILLALGKGTKAMTLHNALGKKPAALLEIDTPSGSWKESSLLRAVARRAGTPVVTSLEEWMAHGYLLAAGVFQTEASSKKPISIFVVGGGKDFVAKEAKKNHLPPPKALDIQDPQEIAVAMTQASLKSQYILLCGDKQELPQVQAACPVLQVDPGQPEQLRALFQATAYQPLLKTETVSFAVKTDETLLSNVQNSLPPPLYKSKGEEMTEVLSDHDTKRFLHAYGVRVSRQAPANSVTAALRIAAKIEYPVALLSADLTKESTCKNQTELKHQATLLLAKHSHVIVREYVSDPARIELKITQEKGHQSFLWLQQDAAFLPLWKGEAKEMALKVAEKHPNVSVKKFAEALGRISACSHAHQLLLRLELCPTEDPVVVKAEGLLQKR